MPENTPDTRERMARLLTVAAGQDPDSMNPMVFRMGQPALTWERYLPQAGSLLGSPELAREALEILETPVPDPEPQDWWMTDQWVLVDGYHPRYVKDGRTYHSKADSLDPNRSAIHGKDATSAAARSGRITPLSDVLTPKKSEAQEKDERVQEAVEAMIPDREWVVVEGSIPGWIEDGEIFMTKGEANPEHGIVLYEKEEVIAAYLAGKIECLRATVTEYGVDLLARYMYARVADEYSPETLTENGVPVWRGLSAVIGTDDSEWRSAMRDALSHVGIRVGEVGR